MIAFKDLSIKRKLTLLMMLTSCALLAREKAPTEAQIREAISGNLCRCTGYSNIVKAIQSAAERLQQQ